MSLFLAILPNLLKFLLALFGDIIVSKWVAEIKLFYRSLQDPEFKAKVDKTYDALSTEYENLKQDRKPGPRG